jgi:uncharacterized alpha-E superfamily protein
MLYYGTSDITMSRGEGYSFMNIGKYLERAILSVDILSVRFTDPNYDINAGSDQPYWKYLLLSISGYELYLKTYRSGFEAKNVIEQVVLNHNFPRSIIYSIVRLQRYFERIKQSADADGYDELEFMIGKLLSKIRYSRAETLVQQNLHQYFSDIKTELYGIANCLTRNYFAYT